MAYNLYCFHPTCEMAIANGSPHYMAPAHLRLFEQELAFLVAYLADQSDFILMPKILPPLFSEKLHRAGFPIPDIIVFDNKLEKSEAHTLSPLSQINEIRPWGWSPAIYKFLNSIIPLSDHNVVLDADGWRTVSGRKTAVELLTEIVSQVNEQWMLAADDIPVQLFEIEQIEQLNAMNRRFVVKSPWSSSGRGLQILRTNEFNQTNRQVISSMLRNQGYVIAEPWHQKVADISFQFFAEPNHKFAYRGFTIFNTDSSGRFLSQNIDESLSELPVEVANFIVEHRDIVLNSILKVLNSSQKFANYCGWLGIDMIVFRDQNNRLVWHPCVEINSRYTMGAIALALRSHVKNGKTAKLLFFGGNSGSYQRFAQEMETQNALKVDNGLICSGFVSLTPFDESTSFGAYMLVS